MKKLTIILFVIPAVFTAALVVSKILLRDPPETTRRPTVGEVQAEVVRVVEGDLIEVRITEYVRLIGVQVPKRDKKAAAAARQYVEKTLAGRKVVLRSDHLSPARDKFRQLYAYMELPGKGGEPKLEVNTELVRRGLAGVSKGYEFTRRREFLKLVKAAAKAAK